MRRKNWYFKKSINQSINQSKNQAKRRDSKTKQSKIEKDYKVRRIAWTTKTEGEEDFLQKTPSSSGIQGVYAI